MATLKVGTTDFMRMVLKHFKMRVWYLEAHFFLAYQIAYIMLILEGNIDAMNGTVTKSSILIPILTKPSAAWAGGANREPNRFSEIVLRGLGSVLMPWLY
jgi:hypothetical protein